MARIYRRAMDGLYLACALIAGAALVLISVIIPYGVYTRYVLNSAASWPEPMAILLTILLTFLGGGVCYRIDLHMRVKVVQNAVPQFLQPLMVYLSEALVGVLAVFMVYYGVGLVHTTWHQEVPEFPALSVGITYMPIPLGGIILLLFVIERMLIGPPKVSAAEHDAAAFD
ncbi:MAG: TRAP transporter small permease [Rhodospirillales bacterium]|nr:TRAP transporter small permease [Rhodospirillales bacterium]MDE2200061.1 TRAP transporter small permease [Rhodospirillales bacterium]MDE2576769.1 TRAP transporter small permease [Rhodospirillales bacterium]